MWKTLFCPKAFPPIPHTSCGFSIYFSTACGKLCGKKKFYTACFVKVCGIHQNSPKTAINPPFSPPQDLRKVWTNSPQPCGKAENPIFLHKLGWISPRCTPQNSRPICPQRRICHGHEGKFSFIGQNFPLIWEFPHTVHPKREASPQKLKNAQVENNLSYIANSVFHSFHGHYCYHYWSSHVMSCLLCLQRVRARRPNES